MKIQLKKIIARADLNPRLQYGNVQALAKDIEKKGQLEKVKLAYCKENDLHYLLDGFRRIEAVKLNQKTFIEAEVIKTYPFIPSEKQLREDLYNVVLSTEQRKTLDIVDYAMITKYYLSEGMKNYEIAAILGCSNGMVSRYTNFSKLDNEILIAIKEGLITQQKIMKLYRSNNSDIYETMKAIYTFLEDPKNESEIGVLDTSEMKRFYTHKEYASEIKAPKPIQMLVKTVLDSFNEGIEPNELLKKIEKILDVDLELV